MLPEVLRYYLAEFGRWTLIKASELFEEGISLNSIGGDLGLPEAELQECILAGDVLRRINATEERETNQWTR